MGGRTSSSLADIPMAKGSPATTTKSMLASQWNPRGLGVAAHFYGEGTIRHGTPAGDVMALMVEPAWHGDALCKEDHPGATWFPDGARTSAPQ